MKTTKTIGEMLREIKAKGEEPAKAQRLICEAIVETMPDEVKATAATNPDAISAAIRAAMMTAEQVTTQLMFLLITQPGDTHECQFKVGSLESLCKSLEIPVRDGAPRDNTIGFRPTQKPGSA